MIFFFFFTASVSIVSELYRSHVREAKKKKKTPLRHQSPTSRSNICVRHMSDTDVKNDVSVQPRAKVVVTQQL